MKNKLKNLFEYIPRDLYYVRDYRLIKKQIINNNYDQDYLNELLAKQLINAIKNVQFYKDLHLNIDYREINKDNALEVIKLFPYIDKQTVMKNPDLFLSSKIRNRSLLRVRNSGGSTGQGIKVYRSIQELMIERAFYDGKWGGYGYGQKVKIARVGVEGIKQSSDNPINIKGSKMLISPYHFNNSWIEEIYNKLNTYEAEIIHSYPSSLEYLMNYMKNNNLKLKTVKAVFLVSERISEGVINLVNQVFEDPFISFSYGLTERTNLAWGEIYNGNILYKIEHLYGYTEQVISKEGLSEIVGTSYWNKIMPFIRYKTNDIGYIEGNFIKNLEGRSQYFVFSNNGEKLPGFGIVSSFVWDYIETFQIVQNEIGYIIVNIVPKSNYNRNVRNLILKSIHKKWGDHLKVDIVEKTRIEPTNSGKHKLVVNNVIKS